MERTRLAVSSFCAKLSESAAGYSLTRKQISIFPQITNYSFKVRLCGVFRNVCHTILNRGKIISIISSCFVANMNLIIIISICSLRGL